MLPKRKTILVLTSIVLLLELIPLIAMYFTNEVNWSVVDFIVAGVLLFCTCFIIEFVLRKVKSSKLRLLLIACILVILLLIWVELAVGIFGSPFAGN